MRRVFRARKAAERAWLGLAGVPTAVNVNADQYQGIHQMYMMAKFSCDVQFAMSFCTWPFTPSCTPPVICFVALLRPVVQQC